MPTKNSWITRSLVPALALGGLAGSLALATPAAAEPERDASVAAEIKPLVLDQLPAGGSKPSAAKTIWLDFDGGTVEDTAWNELSGADTLVYEPATRFTAGRRLQAYQRVVQAFAPFDVNVTATKPAPDKLIRSGLDDDHYGAVAHFTDSTGDSPGFAEIFDADVKAPLGGFGDPYAYDVWISTADELGDDAVRELGHTLGLSDTARPDALAIMTEVLSKKDARGSHGSYRGRLELRSNHEANSDSRARVLTLGDGRASTYGEFAKLLKPGTGNWYRFDAAPGPISLSVTPQQPYSPLELEVTVYDATLKPIASADSARSNEIDLVGSESRTYFVKVEQAARTAAAPGYGNLGVYRLAVRAEAAAELPPPTAVDPSDGSVVTGTGVPGAKIEVQDSLGEIVGTGTVGKNGRYTVELSNVFSGEELMVRQSKDGKRSRPISIDVDTSMQVEIVVTIDPRTITEGYHQEVVVTGRNFDSDQTVRGTVRQPSGPVIVDLGTRSSADRGRVEFRFDASSLEPGKYIVSLGADRDYAGYSTLNVRTAEKPSPKPTDGPKPSSEPTGDQSDDDELPATGAGGGLATAGFGGLIMIGAGAMIATATRRRAPGAGR